MTDDLKNIIESLLFVSDTPLTLERMKSILGFADIKDIRNALERLSEEYENRKGGFFLREAAGGYQLCTRPEYKEWIKRLSPSVQPRFSRAAMETLAIIAWKQPVIRSDIEHIRGGVDCGGVIRILLERRLIRILGRKEIPGRPLIYGTTRQFLEIFDLKDLKDLPSPREIEELGNALPENAPPDDLPDDMKAAADSENSDTPADDLPQNQSDEAPDINRIEPIDNKVDSPRETDELGNALPETAPRVNLPDDMKDAADSENSDTPADDSPPNESDKITDVNQIEPIDNKVKSYDIADDSEKIGTDNEKKA